MILPKENNTPTEASFGAAQLFRHCIIRSERKLCWEHNSFFKIYYEKFCEKYPMAKVKENEVLCLSISDVIFPLIEECKKYINQKSKT